MRRAIAFTVLLGVVATSEAISQCSLWLGHRWPFSDRSYYLQGVPPEYTSAIVQASETWRTQCFYFNAGAGGFPVRMADLGDPSIYPHHFAQTEATILGSLMYSIFTEINSNPTIQWVTSGELTDHEMDVETVMLHEFGHWLNLDESYQYSSTMGIVYWEMTPRRGLSEDVSSCPNTIYCGVPTGVCENCPPVPSNFAATPAGNNIVLSWNQREYGSLVTGTHLYKNGQLLANLSAERLSPS